MEIKDNKTLKLNKTITRRVIDLQAKGYHFDFLLAADQHLICVQNNLRLPVATVRIQVIDRGYNQFTRSFQYIHTIDTGNGDSGLLLANTIFVNDPVS